jgi:hypothetical protein
MRKKVTSWLLAISMLLSLFISMPITAAAESPASGNAAAFAASSNSYISVPDSNSLDVTNTLTVEAWIKPSEGGGEWALIMGKQQNSVDANPWYSYRLLAASANSGEKGFPRKVAFQIAPEGSGETGVESTTIVQNNVWTHVAGVYDGSTVKIYINGVLENSNPVSGSIRVSDLPLYFGKAPWTNYNNYNGMIDEVRVWNVARTAEQISYDMQYSLTGSESGLVGYWSFNEASGSTTADGSANNNDGALYNGAYFALSGAPVASPYDGEYNIEAGPVMISANGDYRIYGTGVSTANTIVVNTGVTANIVLDNVNINVSGTSGACAFDVQGTAQANVALAAGSENTLRSGEYRAGLEIANQAQLTIDSDESNAGTLKAYGGVYGAAGIGGADGYNGGTITIHNGDIYAYAAYDGAGIGSGRNADGCNITINNGNITANGAVDGAGIGSGGGGDVGSIHIHGGTVVASSTGNEGSYDGGSGIGSGAGGDNGTILIDGGTIIANGKYDCPGIGGDYGSQGTITIRGSAASVTASSGLYAAAIGGGYGDGGGIINIEGGTITANGRGRSPGIGDYDDGTTVVNISGGTVISNGGEEACGIGSGYYSAYNPLPILNFSGGNLSVSHGAGASYDINALLKTSEGGAFSTGGCLVPASGQVISVTGPITGTFTYDLNGIAANETIVTATQESSSGYFVLYPRETGMQIIRQTDALSWKYIADTNQPILSGVGVDRISDAEADITVSNNEFAEYFYVVTDDDAATPTIDTGIGGILCDGVSTLHLDSLTAGAFDIYLKAKDMAGNEGPMIKMDIDAFAEDVCSIGDISYKTLSEALNAVASGQTIKLLDDISYNDRIWAGSSYRPSLALDLNGYKLDISNVEVPIGAIDGRYLNITDNSVSGGGTLILNSPGGSAPTGATAVGLGSRVSVDAKVTTTITATGENSKGVSAYYGGSVDIGKGTITSSTYGIYAYGVSGDTASSVTFTGNVSALSNYGIGVYAENGGSAVVTGDITGPYIGHGVIAYSGTITITGNITSSGLGATANGSGSVVTVFGNVTSIQDNGIGAYAYEGGTVNISGNATVEGSNGYGVYANNTACITVGGNVRATGGSVGACADGYSDGSEITIEGSIDAAVYIQVDGQNKEPDDCTEPTTKAGYDTYSYGDPVSTVWVKIASETDCIAPNCTTPESEGGFTEFTMIGGEKYYHISSPAQLAHINEHLDLNYIQTADIDLSQYNGGLWNPIGGYLGSSMFTGRYLGEGHKIENMKIDVTSPDGSILYAGLFGSTSPTAHIEGINLEIDSLSAVQAPLAYGEVYLGGIAAVHRSAGTIEDCRVIINGNVTATSDGGNVYVGGITGYNSGNISGCSTTTSTASTVTVAARGKEAFVGGVAGYTCGNILNSDNSGKLRAEAAGDTYTRRVYVGGIAGYATESGTDTVIENCQNNADIESINNCDVENTYRAYAGGIVGHIHWNNSAQSVIIRNCANISKDKQVYTKAPSTLTGGIAGSARFIPQTNITIENCYNRSNVISDMLNFNWNKGPEYCTGVTAGGIIGAAGGIRVQYCYSAAADISAVATTGEDAYEGGIAGLIYGTRLLEDYYESNANIAVGIGGAVDSSMAIVPQPDVAGEVEGATAVQLKTKSFYDDSWQWYTSSGTEPDYYSSTDPWRFTAANSYPVLRGLPYTAPTTPPGGPSTPNTYRMSATANEGGTLTPAGDSVLPEYGTITFTIKPDKNYVVKDVLVDGISVGAVTTYTFSSVIVDHTIEVTFAHDCPSKPFLDVDITRWYHEGIDYVLCAGLFKGTSATTFEPDSAMTRGMLVTVLHRLEGLPAATPESHFPDVKPGCWYTEAVIWASTNGIVKGYDSGVFGANDFITREQLVTILYRYAQYKGYDISVGEDTNILSYEDASHASEYAIPAIQWACGAGIMQGNGTKLDPQGKATRAQVAAMLMRFIETVVKQ